MVSDIFYSRFFHLFLLALAIAISYSGTLESSWHFDDIYNITKNKNIQISNLDWSEISKALRAPNTGEISRPVALFTFALNYYCSGFDTTGYHLVNISIHILCAFFVYLVFVQTLEIYEGTAKNKFPFPITDMALLGAMLWALHPMQTQAVTYIVQRMASMSAMLYMMAMYCYLCFRTGSGRYRWIYLTLTAIFWVAGVFTKENAVLLPLSLLAFEFAFFGFSLRLHKRYLLLLACTFAIIGAVTFYITGCDFQKIMGEGAYLTRPFSMWERLLTQPIVLCRYLFLIFLPIADFLTIESDISASTGFFSPPVTLPAMFVISALVILSISYMRKFPLICFAALFYFINHLVESTFIALELYFEHRNYLPSIFIYLVASYYFCLLVKHYMETAKALLYSLLVLVMTVIVISEGNATYLRNDIWKSEVTLLTDAIEKAPNNIRPYISLGVEFMKLKQVDKAKEMYRKAEKLYKQNPTKHQYNFVALLYFNAGMGALRNKENTKAIQLLLKSSDIDPASWETHVNLGYLFFITGDLKNAETALNNALQLRPDEAAIYNLLGRTLYAKGEIDSAVRVWENGLAVEVMPEMQLNLVGAYLRKGDLRSARTIIIKMAYRERDLAYLLYRAEVFPEERVRNFNEIAEGLVLDDTDYCSWASAIVKNEFAGLIYPEQFKNIEGELRNIYIEKLNSVIGKIDETKNIIRACDFANPVRVGSNSHD